MDKVARLRRDQEKLKRKDEDHEPERKDEPDRKSAGSNGTETTDDRYSLRDNRL
jgi:hypothetical protein